MNSMYNYYIKNIKPLEKRYNRFSFLYSLIPLNFFKLKKDYYNLIVLMYYKNLKDNPNYIKNFVNALEKNNQKL